VIEQGRDAEFDWWLHEQGYQYIGPTSMYRLTVPEMARLHTGWRRVQDAKAAARRGDHRDPDLDASTATTDQTTDANTEGRALARDARRPTRSRRRGPTDADVEALREFKRRHDLD